MADSRSISALNERFGLPGIARVTPGNGGLPRVELSTETGSAEIYLYGAQVTSWRPRGADEVLFVSDRSFWQEGKAIRGGIPVCFPWFRGKSDDPKAPAHGFARTRQWQIGEIGRASDGGAVLLLNTQADDTTREWWPYDFRLDCRITAGRALQLELTVENTGVSEFRFEEALHTYFRVGDVENIELLGLSGLNYLDNRDANRRKLQSEDLRFGPAVDNAYLESSGPIEILDRVMNRRLRTEKENSHSTIVWNPGREGAALMADFGEAQWSKTLCVEGGNIIGSAMWLKPGEAHTMKVVIHVLNILGIERPSHPPPS